MIPIIRPRNPLTMPSKVIVIIGLWGGSLAVAFLLGRITPNTSQRPIDLHPATKSSFSQNTLLRSQTHPNQPRASATQARLAAVPTISEKSSAEEIITAITQHDDAIERNNALLALIDNLAPEQFLSVVSAFRELGLTRSRRGEYEILLTAWAQTNPNEALDYASEHTEGTFARNTVLSTWATTNPDAALAWAKDNHDNTEQANPWLVGVIEGISGYDIPRATDLMTTLPRSRERGSALRTITEELLARDPEEAKSWSVAIENEDLRAGALAYTAQALARTNPREAADWLAASGEIDALNRASEDITRNWFHDNPEEATAWVQTLPPEAMSEAAEGIVNQIVQENPVQAAEYLADLAQENPDANFDSSIRELVQGSTSKDPELAALWISGLSNDREQTRYYHRVLQQWQTQDSGAAQIWIEQNENSLPGSIRRRFLNRPSE